METILLSAGIACLVDGIIGGGLKAFGIEIPLLQSIARQLTLGVCGVILISLSFAISSPPKLPGNGASPTPSPTRSNQASTGGSLQLSVNNNPRVVIAGGQTEIVVKVTDRTGAALAGANVRVAAGGGYFTATGVTSVEGITDAQGMYRTIWHSYEARAYTGNMSYELKINATKEGYERSETALTVPVSLH